MIKVNNLKVSTRRNRLPLSLPPPPPPDKREYRWWNLIGFVNVGIFTLKMKGLEFNRVAYDKIKKYQYILVTATRGV